MNFELPPLPYPKNALEPHISARTVDVHYEKHHRAYVEKLKKSIEGKSEADLSLEDFIRRAHGSDFNWAAQIWNHNFYWKSMKPGGGGKPGGELAAELDKHFGSVDDFRQRFSEAAQDEFGSGWAWLVLAKGSRRLEVRSTTDAENPLTAGAVPLLTIDVWEHAYYLDYQSDRPKYIRGFVENLIDWDFVAANLKAAR